MLAAIREQRTTKVVNFLVGMRRDPQPGCWSQGLVSISKTDLDVDGELGRPDAFEERLTREAFGPWRWTSIDPESVDAACVACSEILQADGMIPADLADRL